MKMESLPPHYKGIFKSMQRAQIQPLDLLKEGRLESQMS